MLVLSFLFVAAVGMNIGMLLLLKNGHEERRE